MRNWCALGAAAALAGLGSVLGSLGCSDLSNGSAGKGGSTASAIVAKPRPKVEITSPARGAFLAPGPITVEGRTAPRPGGAPIASLDLNGQAVPLASDGTFATQLTLPKGVGILQATIRDGSGETGDTAVGVLAGEWLPSGDMLQSALSFRLDDSALGGLEKVIEDAISTLDLWSLTITPVYDVSWLIFRLQAFIKTIRYSAVQVGLDAQADGLHVLARIGRPNVDFDIIVNLGGGNLPPEPVTVQADALIVRGRIVPKIDAATGHLYVDFEDSDVQLPNLHVIVTSRVIQVVESVIRGIGQRVLEEVAQKAIDKLEPSVDPFKVPLLQSGQELTVDIRGQSVIMDSTGVELVLDANATPNQRSLRGQLAPGSFTTRSFPPGFWVSQGLQISVDDDFLNRASHAIWSSGALRVDASAFKQLVQQPAATAGPTAPAQGVPPAVAAAQALSPLGITGWELKQALPELAALIPDTALVNVVAEALLPPVFETAQAPDVLKVSIGELHLDLQVDRGQGQGWESVLKLAAHAEMAANVVVDARGFTLSTGTTPRFVFDVIDEPMAEIDDRRIEVAATLLLTPALPMFMNTVQMPIRRLSGLSFYNLQAFPDGPQRDYVTILTNLSR